MSTSATVRVEKATSDLLIGPDWTMNMDICDSINTDHWQAKDVVKAVKKRLQHKNPTVQFLALTLLETMIKNCGDFVHFQVVERDILQEMVKIVRKKSDMQVRNKILVLLDSWQEAFGGPGGKYPQYYWAYIDLKKSGVEFPQRSADSALIFSPPVTHPTTTTNHPQIGYGMPINSSMRLDEAMASEMANLSLSDLDRFRSVMELLGDMLKAVNPNDREAIKDEVITDLVNQCRSNQKRLLQMVNSTGDEELLGQGLALNDALQGLLSKHDAIAAGSPLPAEASETIASPRTPAAPAPAPAPIANNGLGDEEEEEDDDFAQLARRNSKYKPTAGSTSVETSEQVASPTGASTSEASSSVGSNALALPDPPAPVRTTTKEQDMIDLLSITLSSNPSPPRTPVTPSTSSVHSGSPATASPNNPQPYPVNQGYIPYNNYVAPWAQPQPPQLQPQPQPQVLRHPSRYPPPPWEATTSASPNPFTPSTYQYPVASAANTATPYVPVQSSRPLPQYTTYGSPVRNKMSAETQLLNANARQTGATASPKPYILQNRLFEDLVDLKNAGGSPKMSSPSHGMSKSPGQGMISGRK